MANAQIEQAMRGQQPFSPPQSLDEAIIRNGSGNNPFVLTITDQSQRVSAADIADAAHFLCLLHGRYPGLIDHAATRSADPVIGKWLTQACEAFTGERAFLTKLTVAAGPITSTPGQDQCAASIINLRSALNNLSQSDRNGCAVGAAFALAIDWIAIRTVLEQIALRIGMEYRPCQLPTVEETLSLTTYLSREDPLIKRAMVFGASQMLQQHRLFWDMLAARQHSRYVQDGHAG